MEVGLQWELEKVAGRENVELVAHLPPEDKRGRGRGR
jgi:hypothetical protein